MIVLMIEMTDMTLAETRTNSDSIVVREERRNELITFTGGVSCSHVENQRMMNSGLV